MTRMDLSYVARCGLWALVVWLAGGVAASAQTIDVMSGEHSDFTRLVLDIGEDRDWALAEADGMLRLSLSPQVDGFAIGQVFNVIPRTRLADMRATGTLDLSLACDCPVSANRYQGRYLIVDIGDPVDPPPGDGDPTDDAVAQAEAARRLAAAETLPDLTTLLTDPSDTAPASRPDTPSPDSGLPDAASVSLEQASQIMAEQLARAAASGLLQPQLDRPVPYAARVNPGRSPAPRPQEQQVSMAVGASPEPDENDDATPHPEPPSGIPIRAETAVDAALHHAIGAGRQETRLVCTGREMAMVDWSAGAGVDQGLGLLRQGLYDERDQLQPDGVLALARHYLYFGFGAEAAFWLTRLEQPPEDLLVVAALVDGVPGPHFPPVTDPVICSDEEFLWRYLDGALADTLTEDQGNRLQRATAALPRVLRDQVAPRTARQLHRDGHAHAARNLRDMLVRGGRLPAAARLQLDLDLGIPQDGGAVATRLALAQAIRDDGADPVAAMSYAMAFDRDTGSAITQTRLIAAEALLRENGMGPSTVALWHEVVLAQASRGQIDRVLELLAAPGMPQDAVGDTLTALFADRLSADDTAALFILARVHGPAWLAEGSVAGRARVGSIAHLRDAGLSEAADMLRGTQRMLILPARPAVEPAAGADLEAAWQTADWPALEAQADGPHGQLAARMRLHSDAATTPVAPRGDLGDLAARVEDSRTLRAEISALLSSPSPRLRGVSP